MVPLFALAIFASALLLFLVQPIVARTVLPALGGSPSVWNTCMLFFQAALLAGYAWAHLGPRALGPRRHALAHAVLLALAALTLWRWAVNPPADPPPGSSPVLWLLTTLALTIGPPFIALAATAPLIQRWFADTPHRAAKDPYFLYAASNVGSLIALLAYPAIVEWAAGLRTQRVAWSIAYIAVAVLVIACAPLFARRHVAADPTPPQPAPPIPAAPPPDQAITWRRRLFWIAVSAVPSSLMLGVTQYLSTDVAAVPLLWIVPLALYLLTFIIAFARPDSGLLASASRLLPMIALGLAVAMILQAKRPIWVLFLVHLATFFLAALVCHARLARSRPHPSALTAFYLLIALGGVLGGLFNAILAPILFKSIAEYPIALAAACAFRVPLGEPPAPASRADRALDVVLPLSLITLALGADRTLDLLRLSEASDTMLWRMFGVGGPTLICFLFVRRPIRFALGLAALLWLAQAHFSLPGQMVARDRTFFGVYRVIQSPRSTLLYHGTTMHGEQFMDPARKDTPLSYYHPDGPIGQVFRVFGAAPLFDHVGLVGLGTGSLAAYGREGQTMTFFEIDPAVVRIAQDPRCFTYLQKCRATRRIVIGDGRLSLRRARQNEFGLIVLDAFSSDAIPIHLLTREAVALYATRLRPGGLLAFHISNQYVDLSPILARIAQDQGLAAISRTDNVAREVAYATGRTGSTWVLLAHAGQDFGPLLTDSRWTPLEPEPGAPLPPLWTDDYSNIFSVFKWD